MTRQFALCVISGETMCGSYADIITKLKLLTIIFHIKTKPTIPNFLYLNYFILFINRYLPCYLII